MFGRGVAAQAEEEELLEAEEYWEEEDGDEAPPPPTCGKGHRSSLTMETFEGGSICLVCFSNLLSDPCSPSHHVSYALSQLSLAVRCPAFLRDLRTLHAHLLVSPLVHALSSFDDEPLARQAIDLVSDLCGNSGSSSSSASYVSGDFIARISDRLSSGVLAWSRRQIYTLHCFGVLLNYPQGVDPSTHIRDKEALVSNLVTGLQLPSEEIRGEILFVLYKLSLLKGTLWEGDDDDDGCEGVRLLRLSLEALLKTQNDDVRLNCIALLTVLARRGYFEKSFANDQNGRDSREVDTLMQTEEALLHTHLINLFADAIKGPLLSSDTQVQIGTLDLISHSVSSNMGCDKQIRALVEEGVADYVFEILRLSGNKDPLVVSCLQVLVVLATAEQAFRQRLAIGFPTLLSVLNYVSDIPLHPMQSQALKLVWSCISHCPGIISTTQVEELALVLTGIFKRHTSGELGMLSETFTLACSTFVDILKSPSASHIQVLRPMIQEASRNAVLSSLAVPHGNPNPLILYSVYLLKETHVYSQGSPNRNSNNNELENSIIEICEGHLLPWLGRVIDEGEEEENVLGVLETFHLILLRGSDIQTRKFAEILASSSWFTLSFGCLGLFPSDQMKMRSYLMLSSVIDRALGPDFGQPIRDACVDLPLDPLELIFLLGQRSSDDPKLTSCQSAVLLILYVSSLYGERLADENQVLASLEQYILLNGSNLSYGTADSKMLTQLVHLYALLRGTPMGYHTLYSPEAEKVLFHLMVEKEWELLSVGIHPTALKWLFQQERILTPLSDQIMNFCRFYDTTKTQINVYASNIQIMDIQMIAELVVSGDNCVASLLVSLLKQLQEEGREDDTIFVVNVMEGILNIFPDASNQFCYHGISNALDSLFYSIHSSPQNFVTCLVLIFNVLRSAHPKTLSQDGGWLAVTVKLLEFFIPKLASQTCGQQEYLIISIFSLVLNHSTNEALQEASKAILLSTSLVSAVDNIVQTACAKGPALVDLDEETNAGETLIFVLLLYFFSLKSLYVILQETLDWKDFLQSSNQLQPLSVLCIRCHDLCRLIHFGCPLVKLVASQNLVELLTRISHQRNSKADELRCSIRYLESMMAVTEGLVFYGDSTVATNCGLCSSIIIGWEKLGLQEKRAIKDSKWCRLVMEELALSLAAPGLASRSFTNQHKPAAHIAIAFLRLDSIPGWMESVFDKSCISGIVDNLSASNVTAEIVKLFRELMTRKYLNEQQIAGLHHLFQVCRKQVYKDSLKENCTEEYLEKVVAVPDDIGKVCSLLIHLMLSFNANQTSHKRLLEEIDIFFQESST